MADPIAAAADRLGAPRSLCASRHWAAARRRNAESSVRILRSGRGRAAWL